MATPQKDQVTENDEGYVYILTNPSFRDHLIKIGMTKREADIRKDELYKNNTALPLPFELFATFKTQKYKSVEKFVHRTLDSLTNARVSENREFFDIDPYKVINLLKDISNLLGEPEPCINGDENMECCPNENNSDSILSSPRKPRSPNITFPRLGIPIGSELKFRLSQDNQLKDNNTFDSSHPRKVISDNRIEYNDGIYSLSGFMKTFSTCKKSFYEIFYYNDKSLKEIKESLDVTEDFEQ